MEVFRYLLPCTGIHPRLLAHSLSLTDSSVLWHTSRHTHLCPLPTLPSPWPAAVYTYHRHTDTQTHRHTDTQTHRHTDTQTHRHTDTQTHRHTDTQTHT